MLPKTFCILPWLSTHVEPNGRLRPCCMSFDDQEIGHLNENSLEINLNSQLYKELRVSLMNGEEHSLCRNCNFQEELGHETIRKIYNGKFKDEINPRLLSTLQDGTILNTSLVSIDLRFSNHCNFKCRTCSCAASSSWYQDALALGIKDNDGNIFKEILKPTKSSKELWNMLEPSLLTLREIYISGGEPLIEPDHYAFLEKLIDKNLTDIVLRYSTNLSTLSLGNKSVINYWSKFKKVILSLSYDGIERQGEFIRKGMNWEKTVENHKIIKALKPNIDFIITPTVSVLNIFHLIKFFRYLITNNMIDSGKNVTLNILDTPKFFNIKILNQKERNVINKLYNDFIDFELINFKITDKEIISEQLKRILAYLNGPPEDSYQDREKFIVFNARLNKIREENMLEIFPELRDMYLERITNSL